MFHEVSGDILLTGAEAIAHGVSPNDDFHSGLALSLREQWPAMYKDFRHYCHTAHPEAGEIWAWAGVGPNGPIRIVCLLTQDAAYGHGGKPGPASTENVNHALKKLSTYLKAEKVASVALPRLATGVGGLSWDHVYPLVRRQLQDVTIHDVSRRQAGRRERLVGKASRREAVTRHTILVPVDFSDHSRSV
jgi:O-acetyl-ADP-ribose deacetylase (regulator of RNase III)